MKQYNRGISLGFCCLLLTSLLLSHASGQSTDTKQPSPGNTTMYLWGDAVLDDGECFNHFSSDESTQYGFGEYDWTDDIDFECPLQSPLSEDMFLDPNGSIDIQLGFLIQSSENSGGEDLLISLKRDSEVLAQEEFVFPTFSKEQISWQIPVTESMLYWEKNSTPTLQIQFNKPGPEAEECADPNKAWARCEPKFRIYYSDNTEGLNVEGTFPIINGSESPILEKDEASEDENFTQLLGFEDIKVYFSILLLVATILVILGLKLTNRLSVYNNFNNAVEGENETG